MQPLVYGVFSATDRPTFYPNGSVRPSSEMGVETLRGRTLLCTTQAVASACVARLEEEDRVVLVDEEEPEEVEVVVERWVVVPLPVVGLNGAQVWEVTVGADDCSLFAGVAASEADAVRMVNNFHVQMKAMMMGGDEEEGDQDMEEGEHNMMKEGEGEGDCSACGTGWIVRRHKLLTAVPPA
jgi:hypothetical protein